MRKIPIVLIALVVGLASQVAWMVAFILFTQGFYLWEPVGLIAWAEFGLFTLMAIITVIAIKRVTEYLNGRKCRID